MKGFQILALTDIHGNVKATRSLVKHLNKYSYNIDLIIIAGDLPATTSLPVMVHYMIKHPLNALSKKNYTHWVYKSKGRKSFVSKQISSIKKVLNLLSSLKIPIIYIPGNVDSYEAVKFIRHWKKTKINVLDSNSYEWLGMKIIGTGGAIIPPYYSEPICDHEYHEVDYAEKWDRVIEGTSFSSEGKVKNVDILLTHEPPQFEVEFNDKNVTKGGSQRVSEIVKKTNPKLVIFGHYHEFSLTKNVKEVTYVNPGPLACYYFAFINITPEKVEVSLNELPPAKLDSINKIYSKRTAKNVFYRSVRFV